MKLLMTYYHVGTGSANDIGGLTFKLSLLLVVIYLIHRFFHYLKNLPYYADDGDDFEHFIKDDKSNSW